MAVKPVPVLLLQNTLHRWSFFKLRQKAAIPLRRAQLSPRVLSPPLKPADQFTDSTTALARSAPHGTPELSHVRKPESPGHGAGGRDGAPGYGKAEPNFFQKPLFHAASQPNSKESEGDRYHSSYPASPHAHISSSDVSNGKLMGVLTLCLAALCSVQAVKASLERGKGAF